MDVSTEWLLADEKTSGPLLWARRHLTDENEPSREDTSAELARSLSDLEKCVAEAEERLASLRRLDRDLHASSHDARALKSVRNRAADGRRRLEGLERELDEARDELTSCRLDLERNIVREAKETLSTASEPREERFGDYFRAQRVLGDRFGGATVAKSHSNSNHLVKDVSKTSSGIEEALIGLCKARAESEALRRVLEFALRQGNGSVPVGEPIPISLREASEFAKRLVAGELLRDLEYKMQSLDAKHRSTDDAHSKTASSLACARILETSLEAREREKDSTISELLEMTERLAVESMEGEKRRIIAQNNIANLPEDSTERCQKFKSFNKNVQKIFSLETASVDKVEMALGSIPKIQREVVVDECGQMLSTVKTSQQKMVPYREFIWDGAADQPNAFDRDTQTNLYDAKKRNKRDADRSKAMCNAYVQLKDSHPQDGTLNSTRSLQ